MENFDYQNQFEQVKKDIAQAFTKALDVQADNTGLRLQAKNVYVDDNAESGDWEAQRDAVRKDKTWGVPVYADVELLDRKTGKVMSSQKRVKIATVPKPTNFGSFIIEGKHYQVHNQLRRKPGIYVTEKKSGQPKTEINIAGRPFDIEYDAKDSTFKLMRGPMDTTGLPLYPILSRLGISDGLLAKTWGDQVLAANKALSPKKAEQSVRKAAEHFHTGETFTSADQAGKAIATYFEGTELRPEVTEKTVGQALTKVTPEAILLGSKELLRSVAGQRGTDDRQALQYKKALGLSDLIRERFLKENGETSPLIDEFRRKILRKLGNQRNPPTQVSQLVSAGQFTPAIQTFFTKTSLAHTPDQTNPLHMLNGMTKITLLGEGGVKDPMKVRAEEHGLHPSHMGFIDPIHTPDSDKVGVVWNLPIGVSKNGENLETMVFDTRKKKTRRVTPTEVASLTMSFPDQYRDDQPIGKQVKALVNGEMHMVDANKVDIVLRTPRQAYSISSNTIPYLPSAAGVRAQAATKMLEQALPLTHREAPLVQVKLGNGTMEDAIGDGFAIKAIEDGTVKSVSKTRIVVQTKDGEVDHPLYNNLPLNNKSFIDATPRPEIKPGMAIKKGTVLADTNFTDAGKLALGTNLRTAYLPWKGYNFEDGIVVTETGAQKLSSEHMHQFATGDQRGVERSIDKFLANNPNGGPEGLDEEQAGKLDEEGVVKKGMILRKNDPLWVGVREARYDPETLIKRKFSKGAIEPFNAISERWTEDVDGEVTDVVRVGKKVKIYVRTREPAQIGDKVTNRHGGKGIITKIIPDGEAPFTRGASGEPEPIDILLNPHGIPTRMNPSQMLETMAGKIAQKTGKPYVVDNDTPGDYAGKLNAEMQKLGISDTEKLYDPHSKEELGNGVLVGPQYFLKLTKQATSQFSARNEGKYDVNQSPLRGGEEGAKSLDLISFYSMLSHGARHNLREMATFKASRNEPFWAWVAANGAGMATPTPEPTFAYKKFEAYLKGAGINVKRNGSKMVLQPMTDVETSKLSNGPVSDPLFLRGKDLQEEKGGLMDPVVFGGRTGTSWGHIDLAEPLPNPVFERPIKQLTGLKDPQFKGLIRGKLWVDPNTGEWSEEKHPDSVTGGAAFKALLGKIDIDKSIAEWTDKAKTSKNPEALDQANKSLKYLTALKKLKLRPEDAYIQTKIPVLPPTFRPVVEMDDGSLSNPGLNTLYRDVGLVNDQLKWQNATPFVSDSVMSNLDSKVSGGMSTREELYKGVKAIAGLGDPIAYYPAERRPLGIISQIKGEPAKRGFFQYKVLRRQQNLVGRGTIIPEPKLGVDEVGLPEEMAWTMYKPFVTRRLVSHSGMNPNDADDEIEKRSPVARGALEAEMGERPVILNRAPSLHKFSLMAFKPQITDGKAIKIPPLVVKGFNADFDGDAMTVHIPVLHDAVQEAYKMLPSNNLYNPGTGQIMIQPQNEAALGLYLLSKDPEKKHQILDHLPKDLQEKYANRTLDKKGLTDLMSDLAEAMPREHGKVVDKLKALGDNHTYRAGFTVGMRDLLPDLPEKDEIFEATKNDLASLNTQTPEGRKKATGIIEKANNLLTNKEGTGVVDRGLAQQSNNLHLMVRSGARGNMNQLKQIVSSPFMVDDHHGDKIPIPITHSFAQGLPFSSYWNTLYGARAAAVDKQLQTALPGDFNKTIMATAVNQVISGHDSGPQEGIDLPIDPKHKSYSNDLEDRFLAKDIHTGSAVLAHAGDQVTSSLLNTLRDRKVQSIRVMSPLTDPSPHGVSAKSYGLTENGQLPTIGDNVGAISGQALSEPLTQMTMRTFHSGGISGTRGVVSGYEAIDRLFKMQKVKRGAAALARQDGKVTKIEDVPGGKNVYLSDDSKPHYIEQDLWDPDRLRTGSTVQKGDIMSKGLADPKQLVRLKGMLHAQNYVVDQIHQAYKDQGVNLKRRAVETVIRAVGNTTKIHDPADSSFLHGDVAPWTVVNDYNNQKIGDVPIEDALGHTLLEEVPGATKGEPISERVKTLIQRMGKHKVAVGPKPIVHEPFLAGIQRVPMLRDDWMSQMGYRELAKSLIHGAATLSESDLHGYAPVPAFAYGAEFGDEPKGRSKKEGVY